MWHTWGRGEVFTGFKSVGPKVRDHWEDLGRRWEDNIKLHLREIRLEEANWIPLALDRVQWRSIVNTVMNLLVP